MKIRKDDNVIILKGKDKGKTGKVLKAFPREDKVLVEGVHVRKHHQKARKSNEKGQIVEKTFPIHVSNVSIIDPKTKKSTRISWKMEGDKKVRVATKSKTVIK